MLVFVYSPFSLVCFQFFLFSFLPGYPAEQTIYLVNEEEKSFHFSFDKNSCYSEAHAAQLLVEPMVGVISPKSRFEIHITKVCTGTEFTSGFRTERTMKI